MKSSLSTTELNLVAQATLKKTTEVGFRHAQENLPQMRQSILDLPPGDALQFERLGYFCLDAASTPDKPVFNRTLGLRDSWAKAQAKGSR